MKMNVKMLQLIALVAICLLPMLSHSQPPPFDGGDDIDDVPIDGGLSLLVAAGIGYTAKKLRKKPTGHLN